MGSYVAMAISVNILGYSGYVGIAISLSTLGYWGYACQVQDEEEIMVIDNKGNTEKRLRLASDYLGLSGTILDYIGPECK